MYNLSHLFLFQLFTLKNQIYTPAVFRFFLLRIIIPSKIYLSIFILLDTNIFSCPNRLQMYFNIYFRPLYSSLHLIKSAFLQNIQIIPGCYTSLYAYNRDYDYIHALQKCNIFMLLPYYQQYTHSYLFK